MLHVGRWSTRMPCWRRCARATWRVRPLMSTTRNHQWPIILSSRYPIRSARRTLARILPPACFACQRWAEWIAWQLDEAAYSVILQAWAFLPGRNFVIQMDRALTLAPRMIAVLSPQYLSALYTQPEWAAAFPRDPKGEQSLLIPVRVQACEVTGLLGPIVYVDLVGRDEATARQRLLAAVRHERAKPAQAPAFPQAIQHTISKQINFPDHLPP